MRVKGFGMGLRRSGTTLGRPSLERFSAIRWQQEDISRSVDHRGGRGVLRTKGLEEKSKGRPCVLCRVSEKSSKKPERFGSSRFMY